ncbi:MAG: dUTP diphosphatase [Clostridia bacterium]|nr:dUTP diphosphatase [Clostridia bacterium]MBQ1963785.1 dUTP diphosphatase [Clostridia bacterium]
MSINVRIKLSRGMTAPEYATDGSAAVDLRAALEEGEVVTLLPGERYRFPTGVAISPERRDVVAVVAGRSGHGLKHGVTMANSIGVIDSDYRGEISVVLINHGSEPFAVRRGDRIAQMMFMPVLAAAFLPVDELDETERGAGGFGHTGVQ